MNNLHLDEEFPDQVDQGNVYLAKFLLKNGKKVDYADNHGRTQLMRACESGRIEIVKLLLDNGQKFD